MKKIEKIKYPATCVVHTPSGAVNCCEKHALQLSSLASAMGWNMNRTALTEEAECSNCVYEKENQ